MTVQEKNMNALNSRERETSRRQKENLGMGQKVGFADEAHTSNYTGEQMDKAL